MDLTVSAVKMVLSTINFSWGIGSFVALAGAQPCIDEIPENLERLSNIIGGIGLLGCISGCSGFCRFNFRLSIVFALMILIAVILQVWGTVHLTNFAILHDYAVEDANDFWLKELGKPGAMDILQRAFECCGKDKPEDYLALNLTYPASCHRDQNVVEHKLYQTGCIIEMEKVYKRFVETLANGAYGAIIINMVELFFAIYLIIFYRKMQRSSSLL